MARGLRGGILGILLTGVAGMVFGIVLAARRRRGLPPLRHLHHRRRGVGDTGEVHRISPIPVIFALFMTDFFDTMGTVIAVGQEGGCSTRTAVRRA